MVKRFCLLACHFPYSPDFFFAVTKFFHNRCIMIKRLFVYDIKNEQTLYHNTSIMEKLGYSKEKIRRIWEMTSEEAESFYHPDDLANAREMDKRTKQLKDDEVFKTEYRLRDSKGNW